MEKLIFMKSDMKTDTVFLNQGKYEAQWLKLTPGSNLLSFVTLGRLKRPICCSGPKIFSCTIEKQKWDITKWIGIGS